ncbi:hypothetical protein AR687_24560 [Flavobacteriaceae bacterium CRH]|nr:hypothetical protein AR687_24560 [Flavobacteriaceae bacterium CRH]
MLSTTLVTEKIKFLPKQIELSQLVEQIQKRVIVQNNVTLTLLFLQIGFRINETMLQNKRAEYGKQIVPTLSAQLETKYDRSFTEKKL